MVVWVVLELNVDEPLIDMRMLAERPVLLTNITALISGFAMFGSFVLVPRFVEAPGGLPAAIAERLGYGFGATATTTGLYLLPGLAPHALRRPGSRGCSAAASGRSGRSRSAWC